MIGIILKKLLILAAAELIERYIVIGSQAEGHTDAEDFTPDCNGKPAAQRGLAMQSGTNGASTTKAWVQIIYL